MGRAKEFDPDTMVRAAMDLFWRRGYENTSMQDLVDHLDIGRGSIYATFGSKQELYLRALDSYAESMGEHTLRTLSPSGAALPAVRALLRSFVEDALADPDRKGCLVTNTAVECLPANDLFAQRVRSSLDGLETAIAATLVRAQSQGELAEGREPRALARLLVTVIEGLRVLAKAPDARRMRDAVEQALSLLD